MKKTTKVAILLVLGVGMLVSLIIWHMSVSYSNKEIELRSKIEAQKEVLESHYDKMWKIIQQKAQVANEYKNAFKDIYPELIQGRYGNENGGTLMKWITESNPNFDVSLYKDISKSIEAERTSFHMEQKMLIDLNNEHRLILSKFPSKLFIGDREEIKINIVSSKKTKEIIESGEENDINIF